MLRLSRKERIRIALIRFLEPFALCFLIVVGLLVLLLFISVEFGLWEECRSNNSLMYCWRVLSPKR